MVSPPCKSFCFGEDASANVINPTSSRSPDRGSHCEIINAPYGGTPRVYGFLSHLPSLLTVEGIMSVEANVKAPYSESTLRCGHRGYV